MGVRLVVPEVSLSTSLLTCLERNTDCLFAVAYLTLEGVRAISEVLNRRLDSSRFSLRVVCCISDFITDPEALAELQRLAKRRAGRLQVRWYGGAGFHAKGYGFRRGDAVTVFTGSWNMTGKALGADSGELGLGVLSSEIAKEAWAALERYWDAGIDLSPSMLREYAAHVARYRKRAAAADRILGRWRTKFRRRRRGGTRVPVAGGSLYFDCVVPIDRDERRSVQRARDDARKRHDFETANGWVCYERRSDALAVPLNENILQVHWRSASDLAKGARLIAVVRLRGAPIRVVDPETGSSMWLLYFTAVRGNRVHIRKSQHAAATRILAGHGITWSTLWNMNAGFLRARKARLVAALHDLHRLRP